MAPVSATLARQKNILDLSGENPLLLSPGQYNVILFRYVGSEFEILAADRLDPTLAWSLGPIRAGAGEMDLIAAAFNSDRCEVAIVPTKEVTLKMYIRVRQTATNYHVLVHSKELLALTLELSSIRQHDIALACAQIYTNFAVQNLQQASPPVTKELVVASARPLFNLAVVLPLTILFVIAALWGFRTYAAEKASEAFVHKIEEFVAASSCLGWRCVAPLTC